MVESLFVESASILVLAVAFVTGVDVVVSAVTGCTDGEFRHTLLDNANAAISTVMTITNTIVPRRSPEVK